MQLVKFKWKVIQMKTEIEEKTNDWYKKYYASKGESRNNLFNPEVKFQHLAYERCWIEAHQDIGLNSKILDVGGGGGHGLIRYIQAGFNPANLYSIDILSDRVMEAKNKLPDMVNIIHGDACNLNMFEDNTFDVVTSSTMFVQITDEKVANKIGSEMMRVLKEDGRLLIFDWRYDFWRGGYLAVKNSRLQRLFGEDISIRSIKKGQLVPPLGRFLSKHVPFIYFAIQALPFLTGLLCYEIEKVNKSKSASKHGN